MKKEKKLDEFVFPLAEEDASTLVSIGSILPQAPDETCRILDFNSVKWSWVCRHLVEGRSDAKCYLGLKRKNPKPGDVVLVRVDRVGHHGFIETGDERRLRIYEGDRLMCVFGNRYATDVYEGRVLDSKKLHLLTGSGLVGTVVSRNRDVSRPTDLSFLGYLADASGCRVNLRELRFHSPIPESSPVEVILVVGTGMSTGKTTVTRKILRGLISRRVRAAGCKLTGSASPRDLYEFRAAGALHATDFSDYGFPSTYGASLNDLIGLLDSMLGACTRAGAQVVVVEVADGFLQRETQMLLDCEQVRRVVSGVVLAAKCSGSALCATEYIQKAGLEVWAVSGLLTNSPLFVREFVNHSSVPVASSHGNAGRLTKIVLKQTTLRKHEEARLAAAVSVAE